MIRRITRAPGDIGDAAAAAIDALAKSWGGGFAWIEGGGCSGWLSVRGQGAGGSEWAGSGGTAKIAAPGDVACGLAAQIAGTPYSYVEAAVRNRGRAWAVRVRTPWTAN